MQMLSFSDHFATPFMTASTVVFLVIECLSLVVFLLIVLQYRRVVFKHRLLPRAIQHTLEKEPEKGVSALLRIYIVLTFAVTVLTFALFWLQPVLF